MSTKSAPTRDLRPGQAPASPAAAADEDELDGQLIGGYRITRVIGRGGMGVIYLGEHPTLGKRVAVKVIPAEQAGNEELRRRFVEEARLVASVASPHVVQIHDLALLPDGRFYMAMEYLDGESLSQRMRRGRLATREACEIALQALAGLAAIHERGLVHRDIKPSNVFLVATASSATHVKVLDLGIAKLRTTEPGRGITLAGSIVGTPGYMAPEQARGSDVDASADIYALGVVLYEMLAGRVLFDTDDVVQLQHLHATETPPRIDDVPVAIMDVALRALAKQRADRFGDAMEMHRALAAALGPAPEPAREQSGSRARRIAALVAVPVAIAAGALLWSTTRTSSQAQRELPRMDALAVAIADDASTVVATTADAGAPIIAIADAGAPIVVDLRVDAGARGPRRMRDAGTVVTARVADPGPVSSHVAPDAGTTPTQVRETTGVDPLGPPPPKPAPGAAVSQRDPHLVWLRLRDHVRGHPFGGNLGKLEPGTPIELRGPLAASTTKKSYGRFYRIRLAELTRVSVVIVGDVTWGMADPYGFFRCTTTTQRTGDDGRLRVVASCNITTTGDHFLNITGAHPDVPFTLTLTHAGVP